MTPEELRERVRAEGCSGSGGPVVAMVSGGRDSVCLLDVAVAVRGAQTCGRCTSTTGCAAGLIRGRAPQRGAVREAGGGAGARAGRLRRTRAGRRGNLQAWARKLRYDVARRLARRAGRARRDRAHGQRPGRDDPVSPGGLAGTARAAGDGAARAAAREAAAGGDARADGRVLPGAGLGVARRREQRGRAVRACARAQAAACRPCAPCTPRPRRACCGPPSCCARRPSCWTGSCATSWPGARRSPWRAWPSCTPRWRGWWSCAWPRRPRASYVPQAGERVQEILALAADRARGGRRRKRWRRPAELHVGGNVSAVVADGELSMVKLPPRGD